MSWRTLNWQRAHGAEIHSGEQVLGWEIMPDDRVRVRCDAAEYRAEKLVICGGAWASQLAPELAGAAVPERQALVWLETKQPDLFSAGALSRLEWSSG